MRPSPHSSTRRRLAAGAVAGTLLLAACGGGDSDGTSAIDALPEVADESTDTGEAAETVAATAVGAGFVDLVGPDVLDTAEYEANELPSVVVDDLTNDRKVNFRNLVPQDKPILLWMWAPH